MKFFFIIFVFLLLSSQVVALEDEIEASVYFAAKDYAHAADLYEKMTHRDFPAWQKAAILYNFGTAKLAEQDWEGAREIFQSIDPNGISSQKLLEFLVANIGLTYLLQAESITSVPTQFDMKIYSIKLGLYFLQQASVISCEWQKAQGIPPSQCLVPPEFANFIKQGTVQLYQARQQQREFFLNQADFMTLLALLEQGIENLSKAIKNVEKLDGKKYAKSLFSAGSNLISLWKQAEKKAPREFKISALYEKYISAMVALQQSDFSDSLKLLSAIYSELEEYLISTKDYPIKALMMHYQLALFEDPISIVTLQNLLEEQKKLQQLSKNELVSQSLPYLEKSLELLLAENEPLARFFLIMGYAFFQDQENESLSTPRSLLENALTIAKRSLFLHRLAIIAPAVDTLKKEIDGIVKEVQNRTIEAAKPFIPAVLTKEQERFSQLGTVKYSRCQQQPWERAIPLFEKGDRKARLADKFLSQAPEGTLIWQEGTVIHWLQALSLLQEAESNPAESDSPQSPETIQNLLHSIQEMELEDKPKKSEASKEYHSW